MDHSAPYHLVAGLAERQSWKGGLGGGGPTLPSSSNHTTLRSPYMCKADKSIQMSGQQRYHGPEVGFAFCHRLTVKRSIVRATVMNAYFLSLTILSSGVTKSAVMAIVVIALIPTSPPPAEG